jgi:hypothetical protein
MSDPAPLPTPLEADAPAATERATGHRRTTLPDMTGAPVAERIVLLEFLWEGRAGTQPVLYLERRFLD